jgi:hypothetical protein
MPKPEILPRHQIPLPVIDTYHKDLSYLRINQPVELKSIKTDFPPLKFTDIDDLIYPKKHKKRLSDY